MNIYLISAEINGEKLYKIGFTRREVEVRIKEFKTGNASVFSIVDSFYSKWGSKIETHLHKYFLKKKIGGEWFNLVSGDLIKFREICEKLHNNFDFLEKNNEYFKNEKY